MNALWLAAGSAPLLWALALAMVGLAPGRVARPGRTWLIRLAPAAVLPTVGLAITAPDQATVEVDWLLLGTTFGVDALGRPLLLMAAILYGLALLMVARTENERAPALSGLLLLCYVGNAGVFVATDVVTLYLCFTVMSLVAYALVVHDRTSGARRAGRIYLILAIIGETAVLVGSMLVVQSGGRDLEGAAAAVAASPQTGLIVALLWVGFGIKVGVVPLHVWLPLAHPAAPTPASAVLSGVMITGGLAGWLRMLPLGELEMPGWGAVFVLTGLAGAYVAVALGVMQAEVKAVLAYSSISQMGFLAALVGAALLAPELAGVIVGAAMLYAAHHGLVKAALFFGVGLWSKHGGGPGKWVLITGLVVSALSLAGLPATSGYIAKYVAKDAVDGVLVLGTGLSSLLVLVGTGSTLLLARAVWVLVHARAQQRRIDVMLIGWVLLVAGTVPVVLWAAGHAPGVSAPPWWDPAIWWDQGWPVLLGLAVVALALRVSRAEVLPAWLSHPDGRAVPPGDLVVVEEWIAARIRWVIEVVATALTRGSRAALRALGKVPKPAGWFAGKEVDLSSWRASGITMLGMASVFLVLSWWAV